LARMMQSTKSAKSPQLPAGDQGRAGPSWRPDHRADLKGPDANRERGVACETGPGKHHPVYPVHPVQKTTTGWTGFTG
jgi:hypothetical protein